MRSRVAVSLAVLATGAALLAARIDPRSIVEFPVYQLDLGRLALR
jgi:hypothetical protein